MASFTIFFGLIVAKNIFGVCEHVATTLQSKSLTAEMAFASVNALKANLQRKMDNFNETMSAVAQTSRALTFIGEPKLPRQTKVPRKLCAGDMHFYENATDQLRKKYVKVIDTCLGEVDSRFQQKSYEVLTNLEHCLIESANGNVPQSDDILRGIYSGDLDFDALQTELGMLNHLVLQYMKVKKVTVVATITDMFTEFSSVHIILPNIHRLLRIYLAAPLSTASGERSFSVQPMIKCYTRSTLSQKRFNHLLILNIHKSRTDLIDNHTVLKTFVMNNQRQIIFFGKL